MSKPLFAAKNITKHFGAVQALNDVSIDIGAGEVHAIIGENGAGKSTLMNICCGKLRPTGGMLEREGSTVEFHSPLDAQKAGIAIAPQEVNLVPALSVAENVILGTHNSSGFGIDWRRTRERAMEHITAIDETLDPDVPVQRLSKAQQQLVQIARAAATSARILIFDEPTAALTNKEAERLFVFIRRFQQNGGAVFYISHRLDEILRLSNRITVLRDGTLVSELDPKASSKDQLVRLMAGRAVDLGRNKPRHYNGSEVVLKLDGLSRRGEFQDVSFELRRGEILGIAGLVGSGRTELGKCIFGVTRAHEGSIVAFGRRARIKHPADAIALGVVYLPEERKQEGIFPLLSIAENMGIAAADRFRGLLGMNFGQMMRDVEEYVRRIRIKIGSPQDRITSLSGGNQQKVIIARWLLRSSRILILDEPTRGIDVNAKLEIQTLLRHLAEEEGLSLIYISSELQEVLDVSDRILVLHEGKVKGVQAARDATQESLLALAMS